MADMVRADDLVIVTEEIDHNIGDSRYIACPRNLRLIKVMACKGGVFTGVSTVSFTSSVGALTDTLVIPTAGSPADIIEQDIREETNNSFAKGTVFIFAMDGTPTAASLAALTFIFRPL